MSRAVRGVLAVEGVETGDGRLIAEGALSWADPPLPLAWLQQEQHGSMLEGGVQVGTIDMVMRAAGGMVVFSGQIDDGQPDGKEMVRRLEEGTAPMGTRWGISVDPDDWEVELVDRTSEDPQTAGVLVVASGRGSLLSIGSPVRYRVTAAAGDPDPGDESGVVATMDSGGLLERYTRLRIRGATACAIPAFDGAYFELADAVTAAASGDSKLPIADRETAWDSGEAEAAMRKRASSDGSGDASTIDFGELGRGYFWHAPNPSKLGDFKLPFATVDGGKLTAVPKGVFAVAGVLSGARGGADLGGDEEAVKSRVAGYYERMAKQFEDDSIVPPWEKGKGATARTASAERRPSADWFRIPEVLPGTTGMLDVYGMPAEELLIEQADGSLAVPLTVLDDGRVFGHAAAWGQCHIGYAGTCVTPPEDAGYSRFHVGETVCADGSRIATGTLVVGCDHAPEHMGLAAAQDFYAHSGLGWASVRASKGELGVWISGVTRPDLTEAQLRLVRSLAPSGDWRFLGGEWEFVGALMVNVPGFPIARESVRAAGLRNVPSPALAAARMGVDDEGVQRSLVAAGMVTRCKDCAAREREQAGTAEMLDILRRLDLRTRGLIADRVTASAARLG